MILSAPELPQRDGEAEDPAPPLKYGVFPLESSLDCLLIRSPSLLLPSPHRSLSRVGEEAVDEEGWCFLAFRLASLKLARGGRSLTPLRVEPSMAFCSCLGERKKLKCQQERTEMARSEHPSRGAERAVGDGGAALIRAYTTAHEASSSQHAG